MFKEFKEFATRGNVVDLAVAFILGGAFGRIVTSLVNDIIMPPVGLLLGPMNFSNRFISLTGGDYATLEQAQAAGAATINYGIFVNIVLEFLIVAFVLFLIIRQINRMRRKPEVTTKPCPFCHSDIPLQATRCPQCTSQLKG